MYNIDKEKLKMIIENSCFSLDEEKNKQIRRAFLAFFSELTDYSKSINDTILCQSIFRSDDGFLPEICVTLMNGNEGEKTGNSMGLSRMIEVGNRVFIDDEFENIKVLIGDSGEPRKYEGQYIKDGQCYSFQYYLKFDRSYVERQELLYKYALFYNMLNPVLYSPYSRKAVYLIYDKEIDPNECELDFRFRENGLNVISSIEKDLFWNISISNEERTYDAKLPYGDEVRYVFEFPKNMRGNYVLPLPMNNQAKIFDILFCEGSIKLTIDHEMDNFIMLEPLSIDETSSMIKALKSEGMYFSNGKQYNGTVNKRIISEADIERSIAMFRNNNGIKCNIAKGQGIIVKRYDKKFRPNINDRKLFNIISREYVYFETETTKKFLTDYINYVMEYLEFYYPEVEWVGER